MTFHKKLPIVGALFFYEPEQHKRALIKGLWVWLMLTSPIIFAILLSKSNASQPGESGLTRFGEIASSVFHEFLESDGIYVYTVSFIAPFLYLGFSRIVESRKTSDGDLMRTIFAGYWIYFACSFVLLVLTAMSFMAALVSNDFYKSTLLHELVNDRVGLFYLVSLYFWYLSILDELLPEPHFNEQARAREDQGAADFSRRIGGGAK